MPIGNAAMDDRTFVEWDKDDLDALGILKIDVLGLGMLSCLRKAFDLVEQHTANSLHLPPFLPRIRQSTACCAGRICSACSRWKAARK